MTEVSATIRQKFILVFKVSVYLSICLNKSVFLNLVGNIPRSSYSEFSIIGYKEGDLDHAIIDDSLRVKIRR